MTHPIVEGLTEAVTMAKLMRENEELRRELAEWQQREASTANAFIQAQADLKSAHDALAEEKALADRFDDLNTRAIMGVGWSKTDALELAEAYRKARGL